MTSHRFKTVVLLSVAVLGFAPTQAEEAPPAAEANDARQLSTLDGVWRAVSMIDAGKSVPAENVKKLRFEFSGKRLAMRLEGRLLAETDITIDETTQPSSIEMTFEGKPALGILALDGDKLEICLSGSKNERPTKFASERDSPNRMLIRLRRGKFEPGHPIYLIHADGTELRQLTLPKGLACGSPDWSPDGKQIACDAWYLSRGEDYSDGHITIVPVDGGEITDLGPGAMPSWSPDAKRIALCRYSPRGVWVMNADGTNDKLIDSTGWGVDWSPTANEIAYTCSSPTGADICIVDPDTETRRTLLKTQAFRSIYWNLSWSPDGKAICFIGIRDDGTTEVARVSSQGDEDGFKLLLPAKTARQYEALRTIVSWRGNAEQILVSMKGPEDRFRQLYALDANDEEPPTLFPGQNPAHDNGDMAWSRDGKRVAYVAWEPE